MVEIRILGPLEALAQGAPLTLGGPKQRALLAVLAVHHGQTIPSDRLIDALWGEHPPATANKIVQGYVSNLRKVLGDGVLATDGRGYALRLKAGQLDVDRFESLAAEGRRAREDGDARAAADRLRAALAVWRGSALADFSYEEFAQAEIARLEEVRLTVLEQRINAELALGRHADLVGELQALVRQHPLRERLVGELMLALYRSGRQADALEVYRNVRGHLVEELGLEPGRDLRELEQAILAQDPALGGAGEPGPSRVTAAARRRRPWLIASGGALLLAAVIALGVRLAGSGSSRARVAPNSLAVIDPGSDRVVDAVGVGVRPGAVGFGAGSLWVANLDDQTVSRIDPRTLRTVRTISVAGPPTNIAAGRKGTWVVESNPNPDVSPATATVSVGRIDPEFDSVTSTVRIRNVVPSGPSALAAQGDSLWIAPSSGLLTRVNMLTGRVGQQLDPDASPSGIAIGDGAIWLTDSEADDVVRVDPTGLLTPIPVGNAPTGIAVGGGGVWVVDSVDDTVARIDPETRSVTTTIPVGRSPSAVAYGAGSVWIADSADGTVTRIDPRTQRVVAKVAVGGSPQALTFADGKIWVTVDAQSIAQNPNALEGTRLRVASSTDVDFMDPALAYEPLSYQLLYATCAQLVGYPDKAGLAGSQLTPEVAEALPVRTTDRTYTFKIRPGFRFSPPSNQPVTAQTFKASIERTLSPKMHSPLARYLTNVVGASAYMAGKAAHVPGLVATGNTLTFKLRKPAPDFVSVLAMPAFCAVPPNTPINPNGVRVVPSAGPYYVSSYTPGQGVVLVRNPNYHGSRPRHFARIDFEVDLSLRRAIDQVESGTADYIQLGLQTPSPSVARLVAPIAARYGPGSPAAAHGAQQLFVNPQLQGDYFVLNTHRPLFRTAPLRQAVNYAINRRQLAALGDYFQPLPEHPTSHYLPPAMAGYRDTNVYPLTPDPVKARSLARGGDKTAVLYTCDAYPCPEQAQIVKADLAAIGLRVQIRTFPSATLFAREATPGEPYDLAWQGWVPDYFDPSAMLTALISDSSVEPPLKDPGYQRKLSAAARLSGPKRYLTYGQLDLAIARNAAPLAAFGNLDSDDFFSARIGCQTYGIYGMDLAALCIRQSHH